jgi:hypothetical protein
VSAGATGTAAVVAFGGEDCFFAGCDGAGAAEAVAGFAGGLAAAGFSGVDAAAGFAAAGFSSAGAAAAAGAGVAAGFSAAEIASTALRHAADSFPSLRLRHWNASAPPGVTLEQFAMKSDRQEERMALRWASVTCACAPVASPKMVTANTAAPPKRREK